MLTREERIIRDGERWRYIWALERELELRATRRKVMFASLALNIGLALILIWVAGK